MNFLLVPHAALDGELSGWINNAGTVIFYLAVWGLVFAGTGLFIGVFIPFITGDSLIFAAGLVAAVTDSINIYVLVIGVGLAAFIGDQVGFLLGRHYGRPYLEKHGGARIQRAITRTEEFYRKYGWWSVVIARFMPWARVLIPAIAGIGKMNYYKFLSANFVGALAWGVGLTLTGYFAASNPAVEGVAYLIAAFFISASIIAGIRTWAKERKSTSPKGDQKP
jgi:membrane-associated protein